MDRKPTELVSFLSSSSSIFPLDLCFFFQSTSPIRQFGYGERAKTLETLAKIQSRLVASFFECLLISAGHTLKQSAILALAMNFALRLPVDSL